MKETLILIPGFANNELAWKYQIEHLKDYFDITVLVMDRFSTRQEMVDYLLMKTPLKSFNLAGHSMGGWVAQAVAAQAPERIAKLLLINSWATPDPRMMSLQRQITEALKLGRITEVIKQYLSSLIHPSRLKDLSLLEPLQSMVARFPISTLIAQLEAMLKDYSSLNLHAFISAPTLVLHSREDVLFPNEHQVLASGIKNSKLECIESCGHVSIMEKPAETTALILSFIEGKS